MLDHFGLLAPVYERFIKPAFPEQLAELLQLPITGDLLDAGGGTGRIAGFFVGSARRVVLADLSLEMLQQSQDKPGLLAACSLSEKLPFCDGQFDRVLMVDALHHVLNQQQTAWELWRILKPGGRLVIEEPDIHHWAVKLVAVAEKLALMRSHFLSPGQILDLFSAYPARTEIMIKEHNAWIVIDKPADYQGGQE